MIGTFSHDSAKPSCSDVVASVKVSHAISGYNVPPALSRRIRPVNACHALPVQLVLSVINIAKVGYSIIGSVVIDMVNNVRLFAVNEKPSKAVAFVLDAFVRDSYVARGMNVSSFIACPTLAFAVGPHLPCELTS
jgi:hypothetical protein